MRISPSRAQPALAIVVCALLTPAVPALAAAPEVVSAYVVYCKDDGNFDDCHGAVLRIAFANATSSAMKARGEGPAGSAPVCNMAPRGPDDWKTDLKQIVDWLAQHPETHALKIDDGMNRAFGAIWNDCR